MGLLLPGLRRIDNDRRHRMLRPVRILIANMDRTHFDFELACFSRVSYRGLWDMYPEVGGQREIGGFRQTAWCLAAGLQHNLLNLAVNSYWGIARCDSGVQAVSQLFPTP